MSDAGVAPVEEHERVSVETPVAPVEVSVDERLGDAAGIERRETVREAPGERVERPELAVRELLADVRS